MRVALIFIILITSSCQENKDFPCRAPYTTKLDFTASELALWTYHPFDTIKFRNQLTDTLTFTGKAYSSGYTSLAKPNNPECGDDSIGYPFNQILLNNSAQMLDWTARTDQLSQQLLFLISGQPFVLNYSKLFASDSVYLDSASWYGISFYSLYLSSPAAGDSLYYNNHYGIVRVVKPGQSYTLLP